MRALYRLQLEHVKQPPPPAMPAEDVGVVASVTVCERQPNEALLTLNDVPDA